MYKEFRGINSFLVEMAQVLLREGRERETRGVKCIELPTPVVMKINDPTARIVTIPERRWNYTLPYVESLWLASGRNDMEMVGYYVKKMYEFSDDKMTMRAGYGPRLRYFNGIADDYNSGFMHESQISENIKLVEIDQFEFVEKSFHRDPFTRQAIISIGDPAKDCFKDEHELKQTKDFPCTRNLHFTRNGNKLDLIVHMRSNDFLWGAGGVNIFNFTFMQEYFAQILGLEIGDYYHIANNLHFYENGNLREMVETIAETKNYEDVGYTYTKSFNNLTEFDTRLLAFQKYELSLRKETENEKAKLIDFDDDFLNDWAKILYKSHHPLSSEVRFINPVLQQVTENRAQKLYVKNNKEQFVSTFGNSPTEAGNLYWKNYI